MDLRLLGIVLLGACAAPQSALDPAGRDAERIADLTAWMTGGALLAWLVVLVIMARALGRPPADIDRAQRLLIGLGGIGVPTAVLTVLLGLGLPSLPPILDPGPERELTLAVTGEQFWWRVRYRTPDGVVELANELRLPVGRRLPLTLDSPDVIHSLWIPALAGKMDLIPGRVTTLALEPERTGRFRGACAEFCGASHAHMGLWVVVLDPPAFDRWLAAQRAPARAPTDPTAQRGADVFLASGCGACHAVRGTAADGTVGPDLTHVGSRVSVAAGRLPNDAVGFRRWLAEPAHLKPGVRMPAFDMLSDADLDAMAAYLEGLE